METEDLAVRARPGYFQADLDQIRAQMLQGILVVVVVAAVLILAIFSDQRDVVGWVVGLSFGLAGLAGTCALLARRHLRLAGVILIVGLLGLSFAAIVGIPEPRVLRLTPLILLCTVATVGPIGGTATLVLLISGLVAASRFVTLSTGDVFDALVVGVTVLVLTWLINRPALATLAWSWVGYAEAIWVRQELE